METFHFCRLEKLEKLEENLEKIWGKYVEHFSFASLFWAVVGIYRKGFTGM